MTTGPPAGAADAGRSPCGGAPGATLALYQSPFLRTVTGDFLRPGGPGLTVRALELCALPPGSPVLDAGCGVGGALGVLREQGFACFGVERRPDFALEAARKAPVLRADLRALPVAGESVAGVLCECVLSLFRDKDAVLREFFRALRPGGRLALADLCLSETAGAFSGPDPPASAAHPPATPHGRAASAPAGCAAGAVSPQAVELLLRRAGFTLLQREDHSRALRELAARMVWQAGGVAAFLAQTGVPASPCARGPGLSYHLFIAEKRSTP